ncbi:alpha-2-macroglobulin-like protein 1 [Ostrinia nubilalis]|uniref:alpha-2-macroglobulin-like protein 1 n=1 Tax=Ostrinia nubilalis TaxID=29057 RepID=UPI0030822B4A
MAYISPYPCTDLNHLFLAPGVLTAGGSNRACVSRFAPDGPARMELTLISGDEAEAMASRELPPGDGGCIDIAVPQKPNTKAKLVVSLWYPESKCSWQRELAVTISSGRVVVAHTERSRYRPGDTLRARVIVLKPDLTPAHGVIDEVWLEGPAGAWEGTRAAQWFRVRTRMGIAQLQHELVGAPTGRWTLRVKLADGAQGAAVFWVGNYELPPFQLSVRHAPRVLRTSERLVWTVCVRYPWTEAVEGMLVIRIRGAGGTVVAQEASSSSIKTVVRIKAPRACHRHAAAARRVGLNGTNPPDVVVADFSFQEDGTRIWQNTTVVSEVVDSPISLQFLTKHRPVISPGLPYKLKVKATRWDDKPASNERIKVCRVPGFLADYKPSALNDSCHEALTDDKGVAKVMFTANEDGGSYYNFQASLHNDSSVSTSLYVATRRDDVTAALGPLRPEAGSGRTFVPLYINLRNVSKPLTVHFVVITRGGTIYRWGATTQCPQTSSSDYIPTTSRNAQCYNADFTVTNSQTNTVRILSNDTIFDGNDPDTLLDRHMLRVMLPIKVTHQMCPDSHLIAYFYYNGELVSASKQFEMDECFSNKVEATWLSRQVAPGGTASIRITTPGPALCALTVVDSAAKWNQPAPTVRELVMTGLRRLMDSHRNLTEYEAAGSCFLTTDLQQFPSSSIELTATWLAVAGVRVAGGGNRAGIACLAPPSPMFEDSTVPRSDFSESLGYPFIATDLQQFPSSSIELTATWLAVAGVRVAGGGNRAGIACLAPPSPMFEDSTVPRSDFSEAWLWRLVGVGGNGSAVASAKAPDSISRFEASAVCLARTGIAISQPAVLQVFREFFIHADCPRRLKRGDATIVRYRLFNYLYEPLSVQIQILTDARLEGPTEHVEWACVPARASVARRAEIRARLTGNARLSVRAKAVRDRSCANGTAASSQASDEVIINITVDPEGVPVQEHKSILLCGKGSIESSQSEVSWTWPPIQPVPGTESLTVWAIGDVTGPLLADADSLVTLPRGCGEQNMARLATNLLALSQLDPAGAPAATAKLHVARGFTRQLQYAHARGGFSAFGPADATPSTWLTAFALRYLRRAHQILTPGLPVPPAIERAERWLLDQQMENGCFRNEGQVFHKELRGGLNEEGEIASVALTAYVIASLVESTAPLPARVLRNTLSCLRALPPMKARTPTRVYAHALLGYTFMRLRSYEDELRKSNEASLVWDSKEAVGAGLKEEEELGELMELLKIARRNGDYVWWETSSLSTSIEATGYALLALSYCPSSLRATSCAVDARAATRWLSSHRSFAGGFLSTQDTLVALEALTAWSSVQPPPAANLTVRVRSGDAKPTLLHPGGKVPDMVKMTASGQLDVAVEVQPPLSVKLTVRVRSGDAKPSLLHPGGKVPDMVKMTASGQLDVAVEDAKPSLLHPGGKVPDMVKMTASGQLDVAVEGQCT